MGNTQKLAQYTNPILAGFYPDPSICRVGNEYYIVNSSFSYFPGLSIFHSNDLVNWKLIGYAMDRADQLDLIGAGISRGLFAPTIRYHKGVYYIVCTLIDKGGNFVITATTPTGPWSKPTWLKEVNGIDPSLFFDEDDKAYITYNSIPPDNNSLWDGHRTIRMRSFDYKRLKVADDETILVNGGTDISKKPIWIEGPHIYKIYGWYYLLCAEGGTGYNHSEVAFRTKSLTESFVPYEKNPILTQRHLDTNRNHPITTVGHADLVETPEGNWYAVFLGCRPYQDNHFNTGRETFLAPVHWKDGWPIIVEKDEEVRYAYPLPYPSSIINKSNGFSGNFTYKNDFTAPVLDQRFIFLRTLTEKWFNTSDEKGFLALQLKPETVSGTGNPAFIGQRQQHVKCEITTALQFTPTADNEKAGLVVLQNETHFYYLCQSIQQGHPVIQLYQSTDKEDMIVLASQQLASPGKLLYLKCQANGATYNFFYSTNNKNWNVLKADVDAKFLSTETAGGFVGVVVGMYGTSLGKPCTSKAFFDWFEYKGLDDLYK